MEKIGILTYHTGFNYGASLQAYALQTVINKYGFECKIINFETLMFVASREMFSRKPKRVKEVIKIATRLPYYKTLKKRQKMFDDYTKNCLDITELYRTEDEVVKHATDFDCIVCGSDQIWNLGQDDAPAANMLFYLNFEKKQRRISYAASFGKWVKEAPQHESEIIPLLKQFDYISVREQSGLEYLKSKGIQCQICLDPTVLLDMEEYESICEKRLIDEPYILMFGWNTNQDLIETAKMVGKDLKLPIYNIVPPPRAIGSGIKRKLDVGPREFLSMVKYAEFVVTNSFHGTAFATTYKKNFVSVVSGKPDTRMQSLLEQLKLEDHLLTVDKINVDKLLNTDYSKMDELKKELRNSSLEYLETALRVKKND